MPDKFPNSVYGYPIRKPHKGEMDYFKKNPNVSGMATEDKAIILNPYTTLNDIEKTSVIKNEGVRLWLKDNNVNPNFALTPRQIETFKGTPYEQDEQALRHTILSRIISGDPSVGDITEEQKQLSDYIRYLLEGSR